MINIIPNNINISPTSFGGASANGVNSTETALGTGTSFQGTGEQNDFNQVAVYLDSDTAGTLYFEWSNTGTDWHDFPTAGYAVSANIPEFQPAVKLGRYFRVRFEKSGSDNQTSFSLKTYYGNNFVPSVSPLNQAVALDSPSQIVRPTYTWMDVMRNLYTGIKTVKKFGRATVGTTFTPIALGGWYNTPQTSGATTLRIKAGGNANDTAGGSGAREVTLIGLDENWEEVSEAVVTAGASASSATTTTFTRLYRLYVSESGTYATSSAGSHAAAITIENGSGGTDWAQIGATNFPKGQSEIGAYTIPIGYTGYVFRTDITIDSGKTADVIFFAREGANETAAPYQAMRAKSVATGLVGGGAFTVSNAQLPLGPFVGPCDIGYMGRVTATTGQIAVEFEIFLVAE